MKTYTFFLCSENFKYAFMFIKCPCVFSGFKRKLAVEVFSLEHTFVVVFIFFKRYFLPPPLHLKENIIIILIMYLWLYKYATKYINAQSWRVMQTSLLTLIQIRLEKTYYNQSSNITIDWYF